MNNTKAFALQDSVQVAQVLNEVLNEVSPSELKILCLVMILFYD